MRLGLEFMKPPERMDGLEKAADKASRRTATGFIRMTLARADGLIHESLLRKQSQATQSRGRRTTSTNRWARKLRPNAKAEPPCGKQRHGKIVDPAKCRRRGIIDTRAYRKYVSKGRGTSMCTWRSYKRRYRGTRRGKHSQSGMFEAKD